MLNCSPQSSLPVPWPFWELRGCTAGDITLFKERAGVARSAQIIPAVKQNLIKVESFFFSLRLCHGVFLQSENYKLRTKRTHCCGKQCKLVPTCNFWIRFLKITMHPLPLISYVELPLQPHLPRSCSLPADCDVLLSSQSPARSISFEVPDLKSAV